MSFTQFHNVYSRAAQKVTHYSCIKCYFLALVGIHHLSSTSRRRTRVVLWLLIVLLAIGSRLPVSAHTPLLPINTPTPVPPTSTPTS